MSRSYQLTVVIRGHNREREYEIEDAADNVAGFNDFNIVRSEPRTMHCSVVQNLTNNEDESTFADRLAVAIWAANRGYCEVEVTAVCLEDPPTFPRIQADYFRLQQRVQAEIERQEEDEPSESWLARNPG